MEGESFALEVEICHFANTKTRKCSAIRRKRTGKSKADTIDDLEEICTPSELAAALETEIESGLETEQNEEAVIEEPFTIKKRRRNITPRRRNGRKADPDSWKQTIRKRLRQSGKQYINANGKVMGEKSVQPGCGDTCYLKCSEKFSQEQREAVHNAFWKLTDEQKNYFYWKYTSRIKPKRRRKATDSNSKRAYTFLYRFEVKGEMIPVCKKFFFATLDITARRIYYFYEHCFDNETSMPIAETRRGKFIRPPLPDIDERLNVIRQHISSFPSIRLSGSSQKRYLSSDLCLTSMFRMYCDSTENPLKQHWYSKVFYDDFNLGFRPSSNGKNKCLAKSHARNDKNNKITLSSHKSTDGEEMQNDDPDTVIVSILPSSDSDNIEIYPVAAQRASSYSQEKQWSDGLQTEWILTGI